MPHGSDQHNLSTFKGLQPIQSVFMAKKDVTLLSVSYFVAFLLSELISFLDVPQTCLPPHNFRGCYSFFPFLLHYLLGSFFEFHPVSLSYALRAPQLFHVFFFVCLFVYFFNMELKKSIFPQSSPKKFTSVLFSSVHFFIINFSQLHQNVLHEILYIYIHPLPGL